MSIKSFLTYKFAKKEPHDYWKKPFDVPNQPETYLKWTKRSEYLLKKFNELGVKKDIKILEIGCNVGRNLNYLFEHGYKNLTGIEINEHAVELMKENYPEMYKNSDIRVGEVEKELDKLGEFDLIFTMAVFMHIPYSSDFIFDKISKKAKFILTIEDEHMNNSWSHYPRDYKLIFENKGFKQGKEEDVEGNDLDDYTLRFLKGR